MIYLNRYRIYGYILSATLSLWITCLSAADYSVNVSVTTATFSWLEAAGEAAPCNIVGKELPQSIKLRDIRVNLLNSNASSNQSDVWIGAYVKYTGWLQFQGCTRTDADLRIDMGSHLPVNDDELIAACALHCKESTFVIAVNKCFCNRDIFFDVYEDYMRMSKMIIRCMNEMIPCRKKQGELCINSRHLSCGCYFADVNVNISAKIGHNCLSVSSADVEYEFSPEMCSKRLPTIYKMGLDRFIKSRSNVSFLTSLGNGQFRPRRRRLSNMFPSVNDIESRAFNASIKNIKPHWTGIFRKDQMLWAANDTINEVYHCVAVSFNKDGSLTPYIRPCHEKLPSMCSIQHTTSTLADLFKRHPNLQAEHEIPLTASVTFVVIGVVEGIVACAIIITGFILHKKYNNRKGNESNESRTEAVDASATYEALSPVHHTAQNETLYSDLNTTKTPNSDTNEYGNI